MPATLGGLAPRLLTVLALFLATAAPARAELVQLDRSHARQGAQLARSAGGTELAPELGIWRVPDSAVPRLRRAGVVRLARAERLLPRAGLAQATGPLV